MNRTTSLYLDAIRFLAAMVVFVSHAGQRRWSGGLLWQITPWGSEAVVVFFVLSGFVIGYVTEQRERTAKVYAINRLARIYSVAIPALILTFVLDALGRRANPGMYLNWHDYVPDQLPWQLLNSLFFTNQIWFNNVQPGSMGPYWSLGYEIPYYVAFGIAAFASRRFAIAGVVAVLAIVGPNVATFFPMWLLGLGAYRFCAKHPFGPRVGLALWLFSTIGLAYVELPPRDWAQTFSGVYLFSLEGDRALLHYYVVATLFAFNVIGFRGASSLFSGPLEFIARPVRWAGQNTFALYLFHLPIMQFIVAESRLPPESWTSRALVYVGVPLIVFGLAEFTERRKESWRKLFSAIVGEKLPAGRAMIAIPPIVGRSPDSDGRGETPDAPDGHLRADARGGGQ